MLIAKKLALNPNVAQNLSHLIVIPVKYWSELICCPEHITSASLTNQQHQGAKGRLERYLKKACVNSSGKDTADPQPKSQLVL